MYRADLHCHSTCSDGTCSPIQILELAKEKGLAALSITDHDTIRAYTKETYDKAEALHIRLLPGVELSSRIQGYPIHILGYNFQPTPFLIDFCKRHQVRRTQRNRAILAKLKTKGIVIDSEELEALSSTKTIGRPHIAQMMVEKGVIGSIQEAFNLYIGEGKSCFEAGDSLTPQETIAAIHAASGKAFLAHPHLIQNPQILSVVLEMDFDGIECYYGLFHHGQEKQWLNIAKKNNWLVSGGSDFHGSVKPQIQLGCSWVDKPTVLKIFGEV